MSMKYRCLTDSEEWFIKGNVYECVAHDEPSGMSLLADDDGDNVYVDIIDGDWELVEGDEDVEMFIFRDHRFDGKFIGRKYGIGKELGDGKVFVFCQKTNEFKPSNDCFFCGKSKLVPMKNKKTGAVFKATYSYDDEDGYHEVVYVTGNDEHELAIGIDPDHESWEFLEGENGDSDGENPVNHPSHYTSHPSGVECIQITEHMGFCLGNAMKYIWRADLKNNSIEDLRKAAWYINREIELRLKQETQQDPQEP